MMIKRHSKGAIFMHWFNAFCWITLLASGFGLLDNAGLQPVGMWWAGFWNTLFQGSSLLVLHATIGVVWACVYALYALVRLRGETLPFVSEVTSFSFPRDLHWLMRKILVLTLGPDFMRKRGMEPELPEQGFYNAGQKMFAVPAVLGSLCLVATGLILLASRAWPTGGEVVRWALMFHFAGAAMVALGLPVHIYMATIAPGEGPAFKSMFTGEVPEEFARHHNRLWYDSVKGKEGKV